MRELADDGLIERRRKARTRVWSNPLRQARLDTPIVRREIKQKGAEYRHVLADYVGCKPGDPIFTIEPASRFEGRAIAHMRLSCRPGHRLTMRYCPPRPRIPGRFSPFSQAQSSASS